MAEKDKKDEQDEQNKKLVGNPIERSLDIFDALIAQNFGEPSTKGAKRGYTLVIQKQGHLVVGRSYLREAGLFPGQRVHVVVQRGKIVLQLAQPSGLNK